jgi:hypothetical protein
MPNEISAHESLPSVNRYTDWERETKGAAGSAAGNRMVGPPSSWSSRDQEDSSWQAPLADRAHIRSSLFLENCHL